MREACAFRVVYCGEHGGTSLSRDRCLQELVSWPVEFFEVDRYCRPKTKWQRITELLTLHDARHARANSDLIECCEKHRPDVLWVDKSLWVWPSTLKRLSQQGVYLVHHFTDALFPRH